MLKNQVLCAFRIARVFTRTVLNIRIKMYHLFGGPPLQLHCIGIALKNVWSLAVAVSASLQIAEFITRKVPCTGFKSRFAMRVFIEEFLPVNRCIRRAELQQRTAGPRSAGCGLWYKGWSGLLAGEKQVQTSVKLVTLRRIYNHLLKFNNTITLQPCAKMSPVVRSHLGRRHCCNGVEHYWCWVV